MDQNIDFIRRFVPDMVVERLSTGGAIRSQELSTHYAVVGFFDVAGFSSLARDLELADKEHSSRMLRKKSVSYAMATNQQGKGAEELVRQLNETLGALIETIRQAGGDVIKFAGDAILVVWLCDESSQASSLYRACKCALVCKGLKRDASSLGLHVGIGIGQLVAAHVGGTFGRWEFFIAGDACTQSALAECLAGVDEVVVSPKAAIVLNSLVENHILANLSGLSVGDDGALLLQDLNLPLNSSLHNVPPRSESSWLKDPVTAKAAEGYVPGPVRDALKSGGSSSSVGGLRKLTVIFFKLYDVVLPSVFDDESTKAKFLEQAQNQAKLVQESAYHYYATLRQFILDDKGFVAIVALGLPPFFHEDNAVRAIKVASRLIGHNKVRAAAGICTGTVFCGVVGSDTRAEYSVAGSCINLAARLMSKAGPGKVFCDMATKLEAESNGMEFETLPSLTLKGFEKPVECFSPIYGGGGGPPGAHMLNAEEKSGSLRRLSRRPTNVPGSVVGGNAQTVVGMHAEQAALARACFLSSPPLKAVFLEGDAGSGKTHLTQNSVQETTASNIFASSADASETSTAFFVWRSLLQDMLSLTRPKNASAVPVKEIPITSGLKRSQSSSLLSPPNSEQPEFKKNPATTMNSTPPLILSQPQPQQRNQLGGHSSFDVNKSTSLLDDKEESDVSSQRQRQRSGSDLAPQYRSQRLDSDSPLQSVAKRFMADTSLSFRERSGSDFAPAVSNIEAPITANSRPRGDSSLAESPTTAAQKKRRFPDQLRVPSSGVGRTLRALSSALAIKPSHTPPAEGGDEVNTAVPPPIRTPSQSSLLSASLPQQVQQPTTSTSLLDNVFHPDSSLLLERMRDSGKLHGRRLSVLHAIMPNLLVPSELVPPPIVTETPETSNISLALSETPAVEKQVTRRPSHFGLAITSGQSNQTLFPISASGGGSGSGISSGGTNNNVLPDILSDSQQAMELMVNIIEEVGMVGETLIVIENAHNMDKASWDLLKKCVDLSPTSWKGEFRVRYIVTYRPFNPPNSHPIHHILGTAKPVALMAAASPMFATVSTLSIAALDRVASTGRRRSVGEIPPSPLHHQHGLGTEPSKDVLHITISNLTQRDAGVFLSNIHHVVLAPKLLNFLYRKSLGNPRALLECFKVLEDQGVIKVDPTSGTVEETTSLEAIADLVFVIPVHVRAQLLQRFDQLGTREQLLLKLASVVGLTAQRSILLALFHERNARPSVGGASGQSLLNSIEISETSFTLDLKSSSISLDEGLELLRRQGFLKPFLHKMATSDLDDEDWVFENAQVKFLVYNQMLHNDRKAVHSAVLKWYENHPNARRDDPSLLGSHAMGAERIDVAFRCFKEGLVRAVLKDEPVHKALGLWHTCTDILDDPEGSEKHGFSESQVLAHRAAIDVLMGQVYVEKEIWEEAKQHLTRALLMSRVSSKSSSSSSSSKILLVFSGGCAGKLKKEKSSRQLLLGDPLLMTMEDEPDPNVELKNTGQLAVELMQRIQNMQFAAAKNVERIKKFSRNKVVR